MVTNAMLMKTSVFTFTVLTVCLFLSCINDTYAQITPFKFEEFNQEGKQSRIKGNPTELTTPVDKIKYLEEFDNNWLEKNSKEYKKCQDCSQFDPNKDSADLRKCLETNAKIKEANKKIKIEKGNEYFAEFNKFVFEKEKIKINDNYKLQLKKINENQSYTVDDIRKATKEYDELRKDSLKNIKDILYYSYELKYLNYKNKFKFFPASNFIQAQLFYNTSVANKKYQLAENTNFIFNTQGQRISAMTELYADFFGPVRVSFGALISNKGSGIYYDSTGLAVVDSAQIQLDATQRFLGGGGNAIIQASLPILNYSHQNDHFHLKWMLSPKYSFDIPSLGTFLETLTANLDMGMDFSVFYTGALNTMTFYAFNRFSYTDGTSHFYSNLNLKNRKGFLNNQLTLGVAIKSVFRLSFTFYSVSDENLKNVFKPMVGFSIIPQ